MNGRMKIKYVLKKIHNGGSASIEIRERVFLIGRAPENDIVIEDQNLPDVAVQIENENGVYRLRTVSLGNVRLNGKRVKNAMLKPGDRFEVGSSVFILDIATDGESGSPEQSDARSILESFQQFSHFVGQERDLEKLLRKIIKILFNLIGGTDALIFKLDKDGRPEIFVSSGVKGNSRERFSDSVIQEVLNRGAGICISNALEDPQFNSSESIADLHLTSVICCPIRSAGKIIGVIYLGSKKNTVSFTPGDLRILNMYAIVAGMLISHVEYISQQNNAIKRLTRYSRQEGIVAESKAIKDILRNIESLTLSNIPVLLEGETGTGKDLVARHIHNTSVRKENPMVVVNCSSLRGELLESELFGHKRGSFTGAVRDHKGLFRAADGGTLFLDEIGEMDTSLQAKLLRTLETGLIRSIGSTIEESVDVRILCATNRNLAQMVDEGLFRKDLFYRINQVYIKLPPLREREDDSILLAYYFFDKYKAQYPHKDVVDFHPDALRLISSYQWPGNVRELAGAVHNAVLSATGPLVRMELAATESDAINFEDAVRQYQNKLIMRSLKATGGNKEQAAKLLGMSRSTFFRYLSQFK